MGQRLYKFYENELNGFIEMIKEKMPAQSFYKHMKGVVATNSLNPIVVYPQAYSTEHSPTNEKHDAEKCRTAMGFFKENKAVPQKITKNLKKSRLLLERIIV